MLITVALFTVLNMLVPTDIGNSSNGSNQKFTDPANSANSTNPDAIDSMQAVRSSRGLNLSWMNPAIAGSQMPKDWCGNSTYVTNIGSLPSPSSIMIGTSIMVAIMDRWNITLDMIASVKYFSLKCWNSTNGVRHPPLHEYEHHQQRDGQPVHR